MILLSIFILHELIEIALIALFATRFINKLKLEAQHGTKNSTGN